MIKIVACHCGSSNSLARNFLKSIDYPDWLNIPITRGREASLSVTNQLPPGIEKEILQEFLKKASKWVIVIGYNDTECKWSDISHNGPKSTIEAEFVVKNFQS